MAQFPTDGPLVSAADFDLFHDSFGRLVLVDDRGHRHVGVEPVRCFPISEPSGWVSICTAEGRELVCVENLAELSDRVRGVLEAELAQREFVPLILRIRRARVDAEPLEWEVETDRGDTTFLLNSEDEIRRLGPHRLLFVDVHGVRYLIPDTRRLDVASRRILERYL